MKVTSEKCCEMMVRSFIVSETYAHHAKRSGYAQLENYLMDEVALTQVVGNSASNLVAHLPLRLRERLQRLAGMRTYGLVHLYSEAAVFLDWYRVKGAIFHFLYGDNAFRYSGHLNRLSRRNALIATFHLPETLFRQSILAVNHLRRLDLAIAVGSSQVDFLRALVGEDKVAVIPHGIDVEYFKPLDDPKPLHEPLTCLCVGHLLRDYETLLATAWILKLRKVPVKIIIVDAQFDMPQFTGLDNVEIRRGIPDEALRSLYRTADIFVLPLKDCTANNALLEALACGLPIITTQVGSVMDYVDSSCAVLTPFAEPDALAHAIAELSVDANLRVQLGQRARAKALDFAWKKVTQQVVTAYCAVLEKKELL